MGMFDTPSHKLFEMALENGNIEIIFDTKLVEEDFEVYTEKKPSNKILVRNKYTGGSNGSQ